MSYKTLTAIHEFRMTVVQIGIPAVIGAVYYMSILNNSTVKLESAQFNSQHVEINFQKPIHSALPLKRFFDHYNKNPNKQINFDNPLIYYHSTRNKLILFFKMLLTPNQKQQIAEYLNLYPVCSLPNVVLLYSFVNSLIVNYNLIQQILKIPDKKQVIQNDMLPDKLKINYISENFPYNIDNSYEVHAYHLVKKTNEQSISTQSMCCAFCTYCYDISEPVCPNCRKAVESLPIRVKRSKSVRVPLKPSRIQIKIKKK